MKTVLFFTEQLKGGGAEQVLENTILKIDKNKFDISVISIEGCENSPVKHRYFFRKNDNPFKEILNRLIVKFTLKAPETLVKKIFIHKDSDVEIAFCEGNSTRLIGNFRSKKSTKKIAWVHTDVINNPWSESVFGSAEEEKKCYEKFDAIVCVSQTMKDSFVKKYGLEEKVHLLYNVIDYDLAKQLSSETVDVKFDEDKLNFISVGRLNKVKGFERLLEIVCRLKSEGYKFTLSLVGSGEEEDLLKKLIEKNNLEDCVRLLGFNKNPHKFVSKSDAYICSSYAEGYSTTVTEAIVLGVPVITTDVSGMREIFGDKKCGIICENSEEGLYNALKRVLDNPECLKEFAKNASERAKDFDVNKRITEIEDFIDSI